MMKQSHHGRGRYGLWLVFAMMAAGGADLRAAAPRSFKNDVMPVFFKAGCNAGVCHGAASGKDGFRLSLFGYDPEGDYYRLTEEVVGRRVDLGSPADSLLLLKATGDVTHTGGELFLDDSESYRILHDWIAAGAPKDDDTTPAITGIAFDQAVPEAVAIGHRGSVKVLARYDDGSSRDVTRWCLFASNNESVVAIDDAGGIEVKKPGAAHVFARYDKFSIGRELIGLRPATAPWPDADPANEIDELVFARLRKLGIAPSGPCTDEQFLRRVTLDLAGRLPTPAEYHAFMDATAADKRAHLVDRLLDSEGFGLFWAAKWSEWLRVKPMGNPQTGQAGKAAVNFYGWIRDQMMANTPLDAFTRQLIEATGSNFSSPESNIYTMLPANGRVDPLKLGEDVAQIFLGLRTQCAQCHNHPFGRWTIDDYYAWTSFFTGIRRKHGAEAREYITFLVDDPQPVKSPVDGQPVPARFLGGGQADLSDADALAALATWMTAADNRLFRENLANRIWAHLFGVGIVDPVDDIRVFNPPSNAPLLAELGRRLAEDHGYDQKKLIRDICLTRTYQTSAATNESNRLDDRNFSHALLRRLRADVLLDAIHQALDRRSPDDGNVHAALAMYAGGRGGNSESGFFLASFGQAKRQTVCVCEDNTETTLGQALHLMNSGTLNNLIRRADAPLMRRLLGEHGENAEGVIEGIFIQILSRQPTAAEAAALGEHLKSVKTPAERRSLYDDIVWSLLNSSEFLFNH